MRFLHDTLPQRVVLGRGVAADAIADEVERLGGRRLMVIAGGRSAALADRLTAGLTTALRWAEVRRHVPVDLAHRAQSAAAMADIDIVVSIGGGSAVGLAKAVALDVDARIIAVPTTYAGSEATDVWGLTDQRGKTTGRTARVLPTTVVYDAELTTSLAPEVTVASGMNALAHCVDSLWAPHADPINEALALEGARALTGGLSNVVADPGDLAGRELCLYGSYLAAVAFASAGSGMHHKICHVLGGDYDLPHAPTHAVLLPHVLGHNAAALPAKMERLAHALGAPPARTAADPAHAALDAVQALASRLGAPRRLADLGLVHDDLPAAAARCLPGIPDSTPVAVTPASLTALLEAAWAGADPTLTRLSTSPEET